jgi:hypothetical protein
MGVSSFPFGTPNEFVVGKRILQEGNHDPCLPFVGAWHFLPANARTEIVFPT